MEKRIEELDYLKCVFIILMIIFHLVYIGDKYPYVKSVVYTFHMPGFLIISGYLLNTKKKTSSFLQMMIWIFIPYMVMESGYTFMAFILPIREHITELTPWIFIKKIFIAPLGPYWYLHTLILCSVVWYFLDKLVFCKPIERFILLGLSFLALSYAGLMSFNNAIFFMAGAIVRQSNIPFISIFQPSKLSLLPLILLCASPDNLNRGTLAGIIITYLSISFLLSLYPYLPALLKSASSFIGRNTLILLLFSPIFTLLSKPFVPIFSFDPSGILFTVVAVTFTLFGSFGIAWIMDKLNITKFFLGKEKALR